MPNEAHARCAFCLRAGARQGAVCVCVCARAAACLNDFILVELSVEPLHMVSTSIPHRWLSLTWDRYCVLRFSWSP